MVHSRRVVAALVMLLAVLALLGMTLALTPGRYADFTVLTEDPRSAPTERLLDIGVTRAVVGGRTTWQRGE